MSETNNKNRYKKNYHRFDDNKPHLDKKNETVFQEQYICSRCGQPIKDISAALADKTDGQPVHFDCVLHFLQKAEPLNKNEAISYIGQGRFAVIKYASMVTMKEFTISRIIEWEDKNKQIEWRKKIANMFSLID